MLSMTRFRAIAAAAAAAVVALASVRSTYAAVSQYELDVVSLVNQERAAIGRAALGTDVRLFNAAEGHTEWMCATQTLSHTGAGGSTPGSRITAAGYNWSALGETIAQGYPTPQDVVNGWKGSAPHWNILMSTAYRDIGVGYVSCDGHARRHYWTVDVANSSSPATPVGSPEPSSTPTMTPTASATATASATRTRTPTRTATRTITPTPTRTSPATATSTAPPPSATSTSTATNTPTRTPTAPPPTATATAISTSTATGTPTAVPPTATETSTPSPTAPPSPTTRPLITKTPVSLGGPKGCMCLGRRPPAAR